MVIIKLEKLNIFKSSELVNKGNNKITELRTILQRETKRGKVLISVVKN